MRAKYYNLLTEKLGLVVTVSSPATKGCQIRSQGIIVFTQLYAICNVRLHVLFHLLNSTWNSAQCSVVAWMGGDFGGEWIHVYVWLGPFAVHLKLSQHCLLIGYTPIQNNNFFKNQ